MRKQVKKINTFDWQLKVVNSSGCSLNAFLLSASRGFVFPLLFFFSRLWITLCNLAALSTLLFRSLISSFSVCVVIYLAVALEVMIVYIQGGTILNTQDSDCLPIPRVTSQLLSLFLSFFLLCLCTAVASLSLFQPDWLWSVTPTSNPPAQ